MDLDGPNYLLVVCVYPALREQRGEKEVPKFQPYVDYSRHTEQPLLSLFSQLVSPFGFYVSFHEKWQEGWGTQRKW